jgi:hypothetical protein
MRLKPLPHWPDKLQGAAFRPHANMMFRKGAEALEAVGRADEAIIVRAALVWEELDRAQPWEAGLHCWTSFGLVITHR